MEDRYGHRISYLRVSVTDRCNERCAYCMPGELHEWLPREGILTFEETLRLIRIAAQLGVSKIRVTGGEPLTRRGILELIRELPKISGIRDIGLSTNGTLLAREIETGVSTAAALRQAGVRSVNISLDTLDEETYAQITGRDFHRAVLAGIDAAIEAHFEQIKLNAVLMRGRNEDQLVPLVEFAAARNLILRFIELMPVSIRTGVGYQDFVHDRGTKLRRTFGPRRDETYRQRRVHQHHADGARFSPRRVGHRPSHLLRGCRFRVRIFRRWKAHLQGWQHSLWDLAGSTLNKSLSPLLIQSQTGT